MADLVDVAGPLRLSAVPEGGVLPPTEPPDPPLHFDAVLHAPPGLAADGPLARFRRPAYAAARRAQRAEPEAGMR
jgi:hypothetical protein